MAKNVITSVSDYLSVLQLPSGATIFRGQGRHRGWPLIPSIARLPESFLSGYESWQGVQYNFLSNFKRFSIPYLNTTPQNDGEWMILARHYGIPTAIMDWTTNPLKALFFAVENPNLDKYDGAVWALEVYGYFMDRDITSLLEATTRKSLHCYIPPHNNVRVTAQESAFTFFPFPKTFEPIPPLDPDQYPDDIVVLKKYVIPKAKKEMCRIELLTLGISHMSLFPDLEGVSKTIMRELDLPW